MEMEKAVAVRGIHKVPLESTTDSLRSVVVLHVACPVPQLTSLVFVSLIRAFSLACQVSLNPLGMGSRRLRGVEGNFQLRGYRSEPIPPRRVGSFTLVQSSSGSDLSGQFLPYVSRSLQVSRPEVSVSSD